MPVKSTERIGRDGGRHERHRFTRRRCADLSQLAAPREQHIGVQIMAARHDRYRGTRRKRLCYDLPLLIRRPKSPPTPFPVSCRAPRFLRHQHQRPCPLPLRGHDHRVTTLSRLSDDQPMFVQTAFGGEIRIAKPAMENRAHLVPPCDPLMGGSAPRRSVALRGLMFSPQINGGNDFIRLGYLKINILLLKLQENR